MVRVQWRGCIAILAWGVYLLSNLREHQRYYSFANVDPFLQDNLTSQCKEMMAALKDDLSCPVCLEQLTPPVVQCNNGHNTCFKCIKINCRECSLCRAPFLTTPNRVLERILHLLPQPCLYAGAGCPDRVSDSHQAHFCVFRPIKCPIGYILFPDGETGPCTKNLVPCTANCTWSGTVKDWLDHADRKVPTFFVEVGLDKQCHYIPFSPSKVIIRKIRVEDNHFILYVSFKSGILSLTVEHVLTDKPTKDYLFHIFFREEGPGKNVIHNILKPSVYKDNQDEYEDCMRMDVLLSGFSYNRYFFVTTRTL